MEEEGYFGYIRSKLSPSTSFVFVEKWQAILVAEANKNIKRKYIYSRDVANGNYYMPLLLYPRFDTFFPSQFEAWPVLVVIVVVERSLYLVRGANSLVL